MMDQSPKAFVFDLNGTMIDDMEFHVRAWHALLNEDLHSQKDWDEVRRNMYGKNKEVFVRILGEGHLTADEMEHWSVEKERRYQKAFLPHLKLIDGLDGFLKEAKKRDIKMAIGSAAIRFNIDFVLDNLNIRNYFSAIVSADDVKHSKPDPETFLKAAHLLQKKPADCIVFEDAPKGVESAMNAGMKTVVLTTMHQPDEFSKYGNVIAFVKNYQDAFLQTLI
ncbi:MAG: HAD family phosphatase [Bacteroidetes bacterium]|nr:HAD family phosphatase [Bacteroidota bacterium]